MRTPRPEWQQKIARERIVILFEQAGKELEKNPERSRLYVKLARKIGTRYNVRLSKEEKARFCKKCDMPLVLGRTAKVRIESKTKSVTVQCKSCGRAYRTPYTKPKKAR
jgi:ribonuclease P protein subunit RPR2